MFQESVLIYVPIADLLWSLASTLVSRVVRLHYCCLGCATAKTLPPHCTKNPSDVNGYEINVETSGNINV